MRKRAVLWVGGTRDFPYEKYVHKKLDELNNTVNIAKVIHGGAKGVDAFANSWAQKRNIPVEVYVADWTRHGKAAGPIRNTAMSKVASHALFVWDGKSRGTKGSIELAKKAGILTQVEEYDFPEPSHEEPTLF